MWRNVQFNVTRAQGFVLCSDPLHKLPITHKKRAIGKGCNVREIRATFRALLGYNNSETTGMSADLWWQRHLIRAQAIFTKERSVSWLIGGSPLYSRPDGVFHGSSQKNQEALLPRCSSPNRFIFCILVGGTFWNNGPQYRGGLWNYNFHGKIFRVPRRHRVLRTLHMADQCLRLLNDIRFLVPHVPECTSLLSATIEFATHLAIETTLRDLKVFWDCLTHVRERGVRPEVFECKHLREIFTFLWIRSNGTNTNTNYNRLRILHETAVAG